MAFTKDPGAAAPVTKRVDFLFSDFGASGVAEVAIDLPGDAIVMGGGLAITTPFNSATSDTMTVGDKTLDTRYKSGVDAKTAAGYFALVPTGYKINSANTRQIVVKWTGVGAVPSAGAGYLLVEYIQTSRADFQQR